MTTGNGSMAMSQKMCSLTPLLLRQKLDARQQDARLQGEKPLGEKPLGSKPLLVLHKFLCLSLIQLYGKWSNLWTWKTALTLWNIRWTLDCFWYFLKRYWMQKILIAEDDTPILLWWSKCCFQHTLTGVYCSLSKDQCKNTLSRNSHSVFYVRGGDSGMRVEKAIVKGAILTSPKGFESEMIRSRSFQVSNRKFYFIT